MVPEHLPSLPYTHHVTSRKSGTWEYDFCQPGARLWLAGCQSAYCTLLFVASCWGGGSLKKLTSLFHITTWPMPSIPLCGSEDYMSTWNFSLECLPSVDYHWVARWSVGVLQSLQTRMTNSFPVGSIVVPEVDTVLVMFSFANPTGWARSFVLNPTSAPNWPAHHTYVLTFNLILGEIMVHWAVPFSWSNFTWVGTLNDKRKLHETFPEVSVHACIAL